MEDTVARTCSIEDCDRIHYAKGYCQAHYGRNRLGIPIDGPISTRGARPKHGSASTYTNQKCRCDLCRSAWNDYIAKRKREAEKWDGVIDPKLKHGTESVYQNSGCRCPVCVRAHNLSRKEARERYSTPGLSEYRDSLESCEICGVVPRRLVLDHDHETGEFRGFLCDGCNTGLGKLGDDEAGLLRALDYLQRKNPLAVQL